MAGRGESDSSSSHHDDSSSKLYKGVRKRKWGKWVCEIRLPNSRERIWLGSYDSAEKAARAFDAALYCLRGPGANFNFPHNPPQLSITRPLTHSQIQEISTSYANEAVQRSGGGGVEVEQMQHSPLSLEYNNSSSSYSSNEAQIDWPLWNLLDNVTEYNSFLHYQPEEHNSFYQTGYDSISDMSDLHQHNMNLWNF